MRNVSRGTLSLKVFPHVSLAYLFEENLFCIYRRIRKTLESCIYVSRLGSDSTAAIHTRESVREWLTRSKEMKAREREKQTHRDSRLM